MTKMEAPYLSVAVCPEPGDDSTYDRVVDLLRERGARPDGDGYFIERHRRMHVQREPRLDVDFPSVEIVMSAGPLDDAECSRRETVAFARYITGLLVAVAERTRPLYGGVAVEDYLPTPAELRKSFLPLGVVADPLFVRGDLLARSNLREVLTGGYRRTTEGPAGTVFASWWPFVGGREGPRTGGTPAGGRLLGRVATRYIVEREGGD